MIDRMTARTIRLLVVCALACTTALALHADDRGGYSLHEWGVFGVPRGDAWAMRDMRAEWASFPDFFYGVFPRRKLIWRGAVRKPVIWFHTKEPRTVRLQIRFADGRPLIWWPAAEEPAGGVSANPKDRLVFVANLLDPLPASPGEVARPEPPAVPADHWVARLRKVDAATVYTRDGYHGQILRSRGNLPTERFIYYDGLMKAPAAPAVTRTEGGVVLETDSDHAWLDVLVLDRRPDGTVRTGGWIDHIAAGKRKTAVATAPAGEKELAGLRKSLQARLEQAGLNADEAAALVAVWDAGLFGADGLTVLYRVPQATYEQWLPLSATPRPTKIVRVGLVLHQHLEPELPARVKTLIARLGSTAHAEREQAARTLARIGGAAFRWLEEHAKSGDAEIAARCKAIIESLNVLPGLKAK